MGKNWLYRMGARLFVLLVCPIMWGLWDGAALAQQFSLRLEGNPSVSSTFGTTVVDGFDTGQVQTVGPLARSNNLLSSGSASGQSASGSYNYSLQAELGHLKGSVLNAGSATGTAFIRGGGNGTLTVHMKDTLTSNGIGDFRITVTLRSRIVHTPVATSAGTCSTAMYVRAALTAPTPLQVMRTCSADTSVSVQTATATIHSPFPGAQFLLQGFLQLNSNVVATGTIDPSVSALLETDAVADPPDMTVKVDPLTPGVTYTTASGRSYLSAVPNQPPVANAGSNQTVHIGQLASLDGSASTDPDNNTPLSYAWSFVSRPPGSAATLSNANSSLASFTPDAVGNFIVQLVVTDSRGAASAPATVTVSTTNSAPIADAGPDQAITLLGTTVHLNGGTSYDPDGDPFTYAWTLTSKPAGSAAVLAGATGSTPSFVADVRGDYVASLVVTDIFEAASTADTIVVRYNNIKPVANAGVNQSVFVGQLVTLDGTGSSDANNDPLAYNWTLTSMPAGSGAVLMNPTSSHPTFVPDMSGAYVISLTVHDGFLVSDPSTVTVEATLRHDQVVQTLQQAMTAFNALSPSAFKNPTMKNAVTNKINAVLQDIDHLLYQDALNKLQHDVLAKTDGCSTIGSPDKNDWVGDCASQGQVVPLIQQAINLLRSLL